MVGEEHGWYIESLVDALSNENIGVGVPSEIASGLISPPESSVGEATTISLPFEEGPTIELVELEEGLAAFKDIFEFEKGIMLFHGFVGERLDPKRVVGDSILLGPLKNFLGSNICLFGCDSFSNL